jgi:uncharacterized protein YbjT (DUF2867 family)
MTGEGLVRAVEGAAVVVDVSNSPSFDEDVAMKFFTTTTPNLLAAEIAAGVGHHVALSVVGTERLLEMGYFRAKLSQERLIQHSKIPYSIVRATQFFEFVKTIAGAATEGSLVRLPPVLIQRLAADDVASAVAAIALAAPINGTRRNRWADAVPSRRARAAGPRGEQGPAHRRRRSAPNRWSS